MIGRIGGFLQPCDVTQMLIVSLGYLIAHLALYLLFLRHRTSFRSERVIFLYHLIPSLILSVAIGGALITAPSTPGTLASAVLIISLQGIYSLSFLELWSLAQGSYSISILISLWNAAQEGKQPNFAVLEHIGARKRAERLDGLKRLGLIQGDKGVYRLTDVGLVAASFIGLIAWFLNLKDTG